MAPVVAVPTTAGTGSEVGRASVITDDAAHIKRIIFHVRMLPAVSYTHLTGTGAARRSCAWRAASLS